MDLDIHCKDDCKQTYCIGKQHILRNMHMVCGLLCFCGFVAAFLHICQGCFTGWYWGNRIQWYGGPSIIIAPVIIVIVIISSPSSHHKYSLWTGGRPSHCSVDHTFYPTTRDRFHEALHEPWDQHHVKEIAKGNAGCLRVFESAFQWDLDVRDSCLYQRKRCVVSCEPVCSLWMVYRRWCRWAKNRQ